MSKIFISHSSADNLTTQALVDWLADHGWHEVFLDIDTDRGIKAAQRCAAVTFLISRAWLNSPWCGTKYGLARALNKPLFGLNVDCTFTIFILRKERPDLVATWQIVDLVGANLWCRCRAFATNLALPCARQPGQTILLIIDPTHVTTTMSQRHR